MEEEAISIVRACGIMDLDRSMYYYRSTKDDRAVEDKLTNGMETQDIEYY
jgi:hypothetical protein